MKILIVLLLCLVLTGCATFYPTTQDMVSYENYYCLIDSMYFYGEIAFWDKYDVSIRNKYYSDKSHSFFLCVEYRGVGEKNMCVMDLVTSKRRWHMVCPSHIVVRGEHNFGFEKMEIKIPDMLIEELINSENPILSFSNVKISINSNQKIAISNFYDQYK